MKDFYFSMIVCKPCHKILLDASDVGQLCCSYIQLWASFSITAIYMYILSHFAEELIHKHLKVTIPQPRQWVSFYFIIYLHMSVAVRNLLLFRSKIFRWNVQGKVIIDPKCIALWNIDSEQALLSKANRIDSCWLVIVFFCKSFDIIVWFITFVR